MKTGKIILEEIKKRDENYRKSIIDKTIMLIDQTSELMYDQLIETKTIHLSNLCVDDFGIGITQPEVKYILEKNNFEIEFDSKNSNFILKISKI